MVRRKVVDSRRGRRTLSTSLCRMTCKGSAAKLDVFQFVTVMEVSVHSQCKVGLDETSNAGELSLKVGALHRVTSLE